jgi:DNA-binding IclR family transcriptional regulator
MELGKTDQKALDYLQRPRTAKEVAEHLGINLNSAYKPLRLLQRLGLVEKESAYQNALAVFKATPGARMPSQQIRKTMEEAQGHIQWHNLLR